MSTEQIHTNGHRAKYLNTVLITVLIALIGGLLKETIQHGKAIAALEARVHGLESLMLDRK